jgi:hypothetical protein
MPYFWGAFVASAQLRYRKHEASMNRKLNLVLLLLRCDDDDDDDEILMLAVFPPS